jgi:aminoglycoside phosphotransferase (APT) family kinase protein
VASASRAGGWSPGSADVVETADGRRAFVKTADARVNERTVGMHRREAEVLRLLDGGAAPALLAVVDRAPWFALAVDAIDGRHPDPRSPSDTDAVLDAVAALPDAPGDLLRPLTEELVHDAGGWHRLLEDGIAPPEALGAQLPRLAALAERMPEALRGRSTVHGDLRGDNALIDAEGRGRLIDWPSAAVGARWLDAVTYLLDVRHLGGPWQQGLRHPVLRDAPPEDVDVWLAVLGAYFLDTARSPEPAGLPGLREYQRAQGATVLAWLLERRPDLR